MDTCYEVLTFESVDEILWDDHSNKTSSAMSFFFGTICFSCFTKWNLGSFLNFDFGHSWELMGELSRSIYNHYSNSELLRGSCNNAIFFDSNTRNNS